jgi:UDPglucose 6-dehydrogenase/GDP-mannose 6-dehydrogenase
MMMKLTIVGTGYVGLVTGACLAEVGHQVVCVDVSDERVEMITRGVAPFYELGLSKLVQNGLLNGRLSATTNLEEAVKQSESTMIAVGTPSEIHGGPIDLSYVRTAAEQIGRVLRDLIDYHVVIVKSTVIPGTTQNVVRECLENASGMKTGEFGLVMNPEFLREGSAVTDFMEMDRIVVGEWDKKSGDTIAKLYTKFNCPIFRTSLRNAELIKYISNTLLATLISFSNEVASMCEAMPDADSNEVMEGLCLDHRLSPVVNGQRIQPGILSYLRAGIGYGGSCLPKDTSALLNFAQSINLKMPLLNAVMEINEQRPGQVLSLLEKKIGKLQDKQVAVLGLAFKPDTDDIRDSPALRLIKVLLDKGAKVRAYDPLAMPAARVALGDSIELCEDAESLLNGTDVAVIATAWPEFREWSWTELAKKMNTPILVDGRNLLRQKALPESITYLPIGVMAS